MARVGWHMGQHLNEQAAAERETRAFDRQNPEEFVAVPFEWLRRQTRDAVLFPTFGWVPVSCLAWEQKGTGKRLPWSCGREQDQLLMARKFAERAA